MEDLQKFNVSDGQIVGLEGVSGDVIVIFLDWQEKKHKLFFKNVIGLEAFSPDQVDLSHIEIKPKSERVKHVCSIVDEKMVNQCEFSFISAWNNQSVLTIVGEFSDAIQL